MRKSEKLKILSIILLLIFFSQTSFGLDSFYNKGEFSIGYGYSISKGFKIQDNIGFGIGIGKNFAFNLHKYGDNLNLSILYNLGFPFKQEGIASWYGKEDHGDLTSSGEPYNMYKYTAAHRTLPFGTLVRVINLKNGKSVVVRINDRGPFVKGRIIDLSYASAKKIGIVKEGVAPVRIEVLDVSGFSIKLSYDTGTYNGTFNVGGLLEFPLINNVSGIFELSFVPYSEEFLYGGGILINLYHPLKAKIGVDKISSSSSPNIFFEILLKF